MLSNTATPFYYGQFRNAVIRGEIPVNQEVSMEMNRIDYLIHDPRYYYDDQAMDGFVEFCENEMTLTDGGDLHLLDTFKLWAEELFSWYYFIEQEVPTQGADGHFRYEIHKIKKRLVNKQVLIITRSAAKTMYDSLIQSFFLNVYTKTTHQVTTAPTMKQAEEVMMPIRTAIARARGPVFKFMTEGSVHSTTGKNSSKAKLASTKLGIQNFMTNSLLEVRPMTIPKLQGLNVACSTVDEWLSCEAREDVVGALQQGAAKGNNPDWVIILTSSEGTVRNGIGDDMKMEYESILRGEYFNPHVSIWYYKLDNLQEVNDPSMWLKANPNLGKTVSYEAYQQDVERAEKAPSAKNDILAKRFNIPMEGKTYFFTFDEIKTHPKREFWRMPCAMGGDLSLGDDFCSFAFLFPLSGGAVGVKTRCYITELTYEKLSRNMKKEYNTFIREGSLVVMPGTILDNMSVYDELDDYIVKNEYDVRAFGYDPYNAREFVERWARENGEIGIEKVIQGAKTESVPLGEIKKLASERMLIFDQKIIKFCMGNAIALVDTNGNRKLWKQRRSEKIDAVAAMIDAQVAYKLNRELFE